VRKNFHASHRDRLEFHEDGVFILNPVVFCSRVGQFPQLVIGSWEVWTSGAVEGSLQESAVEVALHECHAPRHALIAPKISPRAKIGKGVGILDRYAWKIFLPYTDLSGPGGWLLANSDWKIASNTDLFSLTLFGDAAIGFGSGKGQ
jgi:hypothetical protein